MKAEKDIRVLIVEPGRAPEEAVIANQLEAFQSEVGGYIECTPLSDTACCIVNEEGKIDGLPLNRPLFHKGTGEIYDIIAGTFIVAGDDYRTGEFVSLTDEQVEEYKKQFANPCMFLNIGGKIMAIPVDPEE